MNKLEIMVAGHNEQRLQTAALSLEENFTCIAITANGAEAAIEQFYRHDTDIVILDHDLGTEAIDKLKSLLRRQNPELVWADLQPGDDLIRVTEQALEQYYAGKATAFSIQDDAFREARFNITVID